MNDKCKKCDGYLSFEESYYCKKCEKKMAGIKPKKSKDLCSNCYQNFYNNKYRDKKSPFGDKGCYGYRNSKVVIKHVYHSINTVVPSPRWRLSCFSKQY